MFAEYAFLQYILHILFISKNVFFFVIQFVINKTNK